MNPNSPEEQEKARLQKRFEDGNAEITAALNKILAKPIQNLVNEDKAFLQARVSLLSDAQRDQYADVLKEKLPRPDGKEEEKVLEEMTRKDLEVMAINEGISEEDIKKAKKNSDLQELIRKVQSEKE